MSNPFPEDSAIERRDYLARLFVARLHQDSYDTIDSHPVLADVSKSESEIQTDLNRLSDTLRTRVLSEEVRRAFAEQLLSYHAKQTFDGWRDTEYGNNPTPVSEIVEPFVEHLVNGTFPE